MRLCTKCYRLLGDGDIYCPNCATKDRADSAIQRDGAVSASAKTVYTEKSAECMDVAIGVLDAESRRYTGSETEREAAEEKSGEVSVLEEATEVAKTEQLQAASEKPISYTQAFTIEIPLGEILEKLEREKKTYKQDLSEETFAQSMLEQERQSEKDDKADSSDIPFENIKTAKRNVPQNAENSGIIEQELAAREQPAARSTNRGLNKLGVSLFAVLIIAVLVFSTLIVSRLINKPETADESYYLARLAGTWSGEPFRFVDDPDDENKYMELLKINSDATFTIKYYIVNENMSKGYLDGEWEVLEEFSGTVKILPDNATLALMYEQGGEKLVFVRDIIELEDDKIVLREYSDNEDYYYDMAFKRER